MKTPLVALVGRPNVGKSSLFNALAGQRLSIVSAESGTTRDRIIHTVDWSGVTMNFVDTGGVDFDFTNAFSAHIREQVDIAIDLADAVVFVTDGKAGVTPQDAEIAQLLRRAKKPIILAVNKLDDQKHETGLYEFCDLKIGTPIAVSCTQRRGMGDLLDEILTALGGAQTLRAENKETENAPLKIAFVGKPNAGKSSIANKLLGTKRSMVSEIAGTTRDCIDTPFTWNNKPYILTDTAGVRRKRSVEVQTVEHYSVLRALAAIRTCDVVVLVIDATEGITEQDVRLAGMINDEGKPSVFAVNKWDVADKEQIGKDRLFLKWGHDLDRDFAFMPYYKSVFTSALTGQRVTEIMNAVNIVFENGNRRITTGKLNQLFMDFVAVNPVRAKVKYVTQVGVLPPTFALFVSKSQFLPPTYERYLENSLRKSVDFTGTPVKIYIRENSNKGDNE